jgi:hypothetical protein
MGEAVGAGFETSAATAVALVGFAEPTGLLAAVTGEEAGEEVIGAKIRAGFAATGWVEAEAFAADASDAARCAACAAASAAA